MKLHAPRILLLGLFALAAAGSASAAQMKTPAPVFTSGVAAARAPGHATGSPWLTTASVAGTPGSTLLAHDDRDWRDGRDYDRRDDWRRDQWRREQWRREQYRREMERQRYWERHHDRALRHRYEDDHRYYRR
ncbi:hypothetical protein JYG34_15760 [Pseudomonas entomophila]|uniref:hypothetical protein n=1 Tax=Pseudomonas entomophila TaxID=312306 RepID=UPI001BD0DD47|nr:hypothetical protein [Pseudomonas entomophila]QVM89485.1 hypothetical protein JYG34_15760 [Pseudomonas entomophila]